MAFLLTRVFPLAHRTPTRQADIMRITPLLALVALYGCGSPGNDTAEGVTRSEAQALNDAAAMLDNNAIAPAVNKENGSVAR